MLTENILTNLKLLINIISLATPLSRMFVFCSGLVILWLLPTNKLSYLPVRSVYETAFHFKPYSSGITRGLSKILHGDFYGAYAMNWLSYVVLGVILTLLVKDIFVCYKELHPSIKAA